MPRSAARPAAADVLVLGPQVRLPVDAATEVFGVLGTRGSGKSNVLTCIAEELHEHGVPFVMLDVKGDLWGLRADADGGPGGLPVIVLGGSHGDLPLQPEDGLAVASLLAAEPVSVVVDMSLFDSEEDQQRFVKDLANALFRAHQRDPHVRTVVVDEVSRLAPQTAARETLKCVRALTRLARLGRSVGLGVVIADQRPASIHNDILLSVTALVAMWTAGPHDRKAIGAWVDHLPAAKAKEITDSLPKLPPGTGWLVSPQSLGMVEKVTFRRRRTFDSGATPKVADAATRRAVTLASVGVERIAALLAAQRASADGDSPALGDVERAELHRLRSEVSRARSDAHAAAAVAADLRGQLATLRQQVQHLPRVQALLGEATNLLQDSSSSDGGSGVEGARSAALQLIGMVASGDLVEAPPRVRASRARRTAATPTVAPAGSRAGSRAGDGVGERGLQKMDKLVLLALADVHPRSASKREVAALAGYAPSGGSYANCLSRLRTRGLISGSGVLAITDEGLASISSSWTAPPRGEALFEFWLNHERLGRAHRMALTTLRERGPMSKADLAVAAGYEASGGSWANALSRLRTLGLVVGKGSEPLALHPDFVAALAA